FLNRGQAWVARKIAEALPRLAAGPLHDMLREMHASHLANIETCTALATSLSEAHSKN
ncbi:MAG: DUF6306 domain-containing protein, partial [Gammaproteobacteria bacterium]